MNKYIIDTNLLKNNIQEILKHAKDTPVMGIVKCNGYGMGLVQYSKYLLENGVKLLGVSCYDEALELRENGIASEIMLLTSYCDENILTKLIQNDITLTVGSVRSAKAIDNVANKLNITPKAHIELDTGMGRCGFDISKLSEILSIKDYNIDYSGTFSHFSYSFAKSDKFIKNQLKKFNDAVSYLNTNGFKTGILHIANSSAFLRDKSTHLDMVRVGSAFLGRVIAPSTLSLKKIGYLQTEVIEKNLLEKGANIGYANTYKTKKVTETAIIPIGYADGFMTEKKTDTFRLLDKLRNVKAALLPGKFFVTINGRKAKIISRIGMFNIICDVTNLNVDVGDKVTVDANPILLDNKIKREFI